MTEIVFMSELTARYDLDKHAGDIKQVIAGLSEYALDKLWTRFVDTYEKSRPPRRADIIKVMASIGISKADLHAYWYECSCGVKYSVESRVCPTCLGRKRRLYSDDKMPHDVVKVHENCYRCKIYNGQYCPHWGKKEGQVYSTCARCICKTCCRAERLSKYDYRLYKELAMKDSPEVDIDSLTKEKRWDRG